MSARVLLLALLLALPTASAGWFSSDKVTVHVPERHEGDRLAYVDHRVVDYVEASNGHVGFGSRLATYHETVLLEPAAPAVDRFGTPRAAEPARIDVVENGTLMDSVRCHGLPGGEDSVVSETLYQDPGWLDHGGAASSGSGLFGSSTTKTSWIPDRAYDDGACFDQSPMAGRTVSEGDVLTLREALPLRPIWGNDGYGAIRGSAAKATTFQGRDALSITFVLPGQGPVEARTETLLLADGLPLAKIESATMLNGTLLPTTLELVGYEAGSGPARAPDVGAALPRVDPSLPRATHDPLKFDDDTLPIQFHYKDAFAALRTDPTVGLSSWLSAHPEAILRAATYLNDAQGSGAVRADGTWSLWFSANGSTFAAMASRGSAHAGPVGIPLPSAGPMETYGQAWHREDVFGLSHPDSVVSTDVLLAKAKANGLKADAITSMAFFLMPDAKGVPIAVLSLSDAPFGSNARDTEGRQVTLDAIGGGLDSVATVRSHTEETPGILPAPAGGVSASPSRVQTLAALAGPGALAGGAAVTGLALLLLLAKLLLIPLFTRLRRDRLLENPTRARLYERIRAEPGIHRADLIDFVGIGEGATRHHLRQLVSHRLVVELESEGYARYFATGEVPPALARREALLRAGSLREVYDLYASEPGVSLREAGRRLGMSAPSVHKAKKRLEGAGLLPAAPEAVVTPA